MSIRIISRAVLATVLSGLTVTAAVAGNGDSRNWCSEALLEGNYGFSFSGHLASGEAFASVGVQHFDGEGGIEVIGTTHIGALLIRPSIFHGTYELNADCSGTMVAIYPDGSTGEADIVSTAHGRTVYAVLATPGFAVTGILTRQ